MLFLVEICLYLLCFNIMTLIKMGHVSSILKESCDGTKARPRGDTPCWEAQCKIALKEKVRGNMAKGQKYPGIMF